MKKKLIAVLCFLTLLITGAVGTFALASGDNAVNALKKTANTTQKIVGTPHIIEVSAKPLEEETASGTWRNLHFQIIADNALNYDEGDKLVFSTFTPEAILYKKGAIVTTHGGMNSMLNWSSNISWAVGDDYYGQGIGVKDQNGYGIVTYKGGYPVANAMVNVLTNGWYEREFDLPKEVWGSRNRRLDGLFEVTAPKSILPETMRIYYKDLRLVKKNGDIQYLNVDGLGKNVALPTAAMSINNMSDFSMKYIKESDFFNTSAINDFTIPTQIKAGETIALPENIVGKYYDGTDFTVDKAGTTLEETQSYICYAGEAARYGLADFVATKGGTVEVHIFKEKKVDDANKNNIDIEKVVKVNVLPLTEDLSAPAFLMPELSASVVMGEKINIPSFPTVKGGSGLYTNTIEAIDCYGQKTLIQNGEFIAKTQGLYTFNYTSKDSNGKTTVKSAKVNCLASDNSVLKVSVDAIDSSVRANDGVSKRVSFAIYGEGENYQLKKGDKLIYDIYSPLNADGVGSIGLMLETDRIAARDKEKNPELRDMDEIKTKASTVLENANIKDSKGVLAGRMGALKDSGFSTDWLTRTIALPDVFTTANNLPIEEAVIDAFVFNSDAYEKITAPIEVYFKNIRIESADGSCYYFMTDATSEGRKAQKSGEIYSQGIRLVDSDDANTWGMICFSTKTMNPISGVYTTFGSRIQTGAVIDINSSVMYSDFAKNQFMSFSQLTEGSVAVKHNGAAVTLTDNKFNVDKAGKYEITVNYKLGDAAKSQTFTLYAYSATAPVITDVIYSAYKKSSAINIQNTSAMASSGEKISVNVSVKDSAGKDVILNGGSFTADSKDGYSIVYTATDAFGNTSYLVKNIACQSSFNLIMTIVAIAVVVLGAGLCVFAVLFKKRRAV